MLKQKKIVKRNNTFLYDSWDDATNRKLTVQQNKGAPLKKLAFLADASAKGEGGSTPAAQNKNNA